MHTTRIGIRHLPKIYCRSTHTSTGRLSSAVLPAASFDLPVDSPPSHASPSGPKPALSRMPTGMLVRSLALSSLMSQSWLMGPSLAAMGFIIKSKSALFNPDKNPILNRIMRWVLYDHFCAGTNASEVARSAGQLKRMGFRGVILGFAKEVVLPNNGTEAANQTDYTAAEYQVLKEWKDGTLETLKMMGTDDLLAIKLSGAGPIAVDAMRGRKAMPEPLAQAMDEICQQTKIQGARLWIDAEQQAVQQALDDWTINLMRKYNRGSVPLVYNTIQAYLKSAEDNAKRHITLAAQEGWTVAVKLVRGAYIEHEVRSLIHDTKEDTDRAYNTVADMFVSQRMPSTGTNEKLQFPKSALFLATHNGASVEKATQTYRQRASVGLPTTNLECGQLQGMADELSCSLLQKHEDTEAGQVSPPGVFKSQPWGSVSECLGYLHRRAVENRGAVAETAHMQKALSKELHRRIFG